jgi:D-sedoheptulose 7-phosphate isomerase
VTISAVFAEHAAVMEAAARTVAPALEGVAAATVACFGRRGTVFACGNGGSASDAQHLVGELVGRFKVERRALPAVTLGTEVATLTAVANDYAYDRVFARQLEALARPGDLLFAISTSGNSPSVLAAVAVAKAREVTVVALTGAGGGKLAPLADHWIEAPSKVTARIQEVHGLCIHALCEAVDAALAKEPSP